MKVVLFALALISQSALALPIVCESHEKTGDISTLRVKINKERPVNQNGRTWDLHLIGISPVGQGERRQIMYGSGSPRPESIKMTIVKDGYVYGFVDVDSPEKNGLFSGKVRFGGILRGREISVDCLDEAIHGVQSR